MNHCTGHPVVDAIANLHLQGNLVPHSWYQHIRYTNKRGEFTDHTACLILADIVYWYRPIEVRDETTGQLLGYRKKFAEDKLQRSPEAFAELLHCSVKVVREALRLLSTLNLIDTELRSIRTAFGVIPTAMFIGLNAKRIAEITSLHSKPPVNEKSLLPKSVRRADEMGTEPLPNGNRTLPKSVRGSDEMGDNSIYRDYSEDSQRPHTPSGVRAEEPFGRRPVHPYKKTEKSISSDPWMDGVNPLPEFIEWVYQKRKGSGSTIASPENAAIEIRDNYANAEIFWKGFLLATKGVKVGDATISEEDYPRLLQEALNRGENEFHFVWKGNSKQEAARRNAWLDKLEAAAKEVV